MDERGQGALEYLLLIGGAILLVLIVLVVIRAGPFGNAESKLGEGGAAYVNATNYGNIAGH